MISFFTQIGFLNPLALWALTLLPILWILLRVLPPKPQTILFAPIRFLKELQVQNQVTAKTPWWILLLRCLIVACIIIAFARPVFQVSKDAAPTAPLLIVFENNWASAAHWNTARTHARSAIRSHAVSGQPIYILKTTPGYDTQAADLLHGPLEESGALGVIESAQALPWPSSFKDAGQALETINLKDTPQIIWIGTGLFTQDPAPLTDRLQALNADITYIAPPEEKTALLLKQEDNRYHIIQADTVTPNREAVIRVTVRHEDISRTQTVTLTGRTTPIALPDTISPETLGQLQIMNSLSAGSVFYVQPPTSRKTIGLISETSAQDIKPYIDGLFYLGRALSENAHVQTGTLTSFLEEETQPHILITQGRLDQSPGIQSALSTWIETGGILLRFADETLLDNNNTADSFLPVDLRANQRVLDGRLNWDSEKILDRFESGSPLSDLAINETITIKRQILADPQTLSEERIWARLDDGTPLITAQKRGVGHVLLVHTGAAPVWSDLPLSGLYVRLLERITELSGRTSIDNITDETLTLTHMMDHTGKLSATDREVSVTPEQFFEDPLSANMPPGLYTQQDMSIPLNLGEKISTLRTARQYLSSDVTYQSFTSETQKDLQALFLMLAFILFLIDWIILIVMTSSKLSFLLNTRSQAFLIAFLCGGILLTSPQAFAQTHNTNDGITLAYIKTGISSVDRISQQGLENLGYALEQRTSVEIAGVTDITDRTESLSFFPFVYMPVTPNFNKPSTAILERLKNYLAMGGTLVIDFKTGRPNTNALRDMAAATNLPALSPITEDHVLGKSFYLLEDYPGRYNNAKPWIDTRDLDTRDGVSSVIVSYNDWGGAWAQLHSTARADGTRSLLYGQSRQEEMALRVGINLIMYSLTGSYKADQVHMPTILERLGK